MKFPRRSRQGSLTLELLLVTPILVTLLGATVVFGMILVALQVVTTASREGARAASVGGCPDAAPAAQQLLMGKLAGATVDCNDDGTNVSVTVSIPASQAVPNLLKNVGLCLDNVIIASTTVMKKE